MAIIAANTLPREENVGREHDVLKILDELETISSLTGLKLNLNMYIHEEYNSQILDKLENVIVEPDDILFFYYSGHGYRDNKNDQDQSFWPNFHITLENKGVDYQRITEILQEKRPRLLFSLANSCNKTLNRDIEIVKRKLSSNVAIISWNNRKASVSNIKGKYQKLFLETSGVLISSSSMPGEYSYRSPRTGSIYLDAFLNSLHEAPEDDDSCWESIFQEVIQKTNEATKGRQNPQVEMTLFP